MTKTAQNLKSYVSDFTGLNMLNVIVHSLQLERGWTHMGCWEKTSSLLKENGRSAGFAKWPLNKLHPSGTLSIRHLTKGDMFSHLIPAGKHGGGRVIILGHVIVTGPEHLAVINSIMNSRLPKHSGVRHEAICPTGKAQLKSIHTIGQSFTNIDVEMIVPCTQAHRQIYCCCHHVFVSKSTNRLVQCACTDVWLL